METIGLVLNASIYNAKFCFSCFYDSQSIEPLYGGREGPSAENVKTEIANTEIFETVMSHRVNDVDRSIY